MKITQVTGNAFYLPDDDIDTDRIIPARYLECVTFDGLGDHVFEDDRKQLGGKHPFDNPDNKGCEILVAGANFGCGSSREHAVAAIQRWGIKAIIAPSFAAIFRGNATANGLVCVDANEELHGHIRGVLEAGCKRLIIDLNTMKVSYQPVIDGDIFISPLNLTMPHADRDMLTTGTWDTTATLLQAGGRIESTAAKLPYMQAA